jgi:hypothetical protein
MSLTPGGSNGGQETPPAWLVSAMQGMQLQYPNDLLDIKYSLTTSTPGWRIKCMDCPGKLYIPGPGETLSDFVVHVKNRVHRQRVSDRLAGAGGPPAASPTASSLPTASFPHNLLSHSASELQTTITELDGLEEGDISAPSGSMESSEEQGTPTPPTSIPTSQPISNSAPAATGPPLSPPAWLSSATHTMHLQYPDDRFIIEPRQVNNSPAWRIRCLDCPTKLYSPGPGETLSNFTVHLRNRDHRRRVTGRLAATEES